MMEITAALVKELREKTGAGMMDCKKALTEAGGDLEKATNYLREQGILKAAKKADRAVNEGIVFSYIHPGDKLGVLVEVNCETDFVARNTDFRDLVKNIAMQVAAANPRVIIRDELPSDLIEQEKKIYRTQAINEGRPEKIIDKIVEGKLEKYFQEACLLEQPFIKDPNRTIKDLLTEKIAVIGENISVRRFVRYRLGE
ncbi:MAG: elongation factor Ts [candidate division Zixibacteria bacterium CG_4_9_14_3_um_filter_46_8]|nr:MAG: elongation factor Ts [candidate division Zixibacteria bacterium CG_4_9_14_3_um_filter_46_8]